MKVMALLIITLNSLNTSVSKRKHEENEKESFYFLNAYNKTNPIKNNPYFSTNETLTSFTLAQLNTQPFKHGKYEDFENPNKYHTNNDVNKLPCSSKGVFDQCLNDIKNTDRLNNFQYLPQTTNQVNSVPNTISQFYSYVSDFNNETEASNSEKMNKVTQTHQFCDEIIFPARSSNVSTSGDLQTTIVVNTPSVRKKIENLGEYIFRYIIQNIPKSYISSHTRRLKIIKEVYNIFDKHKPNPVLYHTVFNHLYYKQSLHDLIMMYLSFDKNSIFNKKTCENFDYEFNARILYSHNSTNLRAKMDFLVNEQKKIIFFSEIMELYKYTDDIPEIMFLFSLFDENSYKKITFVLHLMILFADKIKNIKENRVFILCMIFKAINIFYNGSFDIFLLPIYELKCHKELHDLSFFTWEFNAFKRRDLRVTRTSLNACSASDIKYLKAVFLNYLYQHTIFIKYYDIGSNGIKLYQDLLEKITQPSECFACILNEYLSLVQTCFKDKL